MQTAYVVPAINSVWGVKQLDLLTSIREAGQDLILGGDARCSRKNNQLQQLPNHRNQMPKF